MGLSVSLNHLATGGSFPLNMMVDLFPHLSIHTCTPAATVLQCTEPYQAKEIGDKVKVTDVWDFSKREAVMKTLIDVKFSTGSALAKELLDTGKKIIVESGRDNYYACGLSFNNKNILDR